MNLYENHFSYIKDLACYSKSFQWKGANKLRRHKKTCDGKVQLKYPGGAYHVPKTVFEELEEEGIIIPDEARYLPYRATYDFECYFNQEKAQELKNTKKLTWQTSHVPLSVSVCSNVPGYQAPNCFVSNGDPKQTLEDFVQYLTEISTMSSSLLREQYATVFEALKTARDPEKRETDEDRLAPMLVELQEGNEQETETGEESKDERRGIDLMASDDEGDEEEIESENREDRAFLDKEVSEDDPSFGQKTRSEATAQRASRARRFTVWRGTDQR